MKNQPLYLRVNSNMDRYTITKKVPEATIWDSREHAMIVGYKLCIDDSTWFLVETTRNTIYN